MEDRHELSEPRPVLSDTAAGGPSWDVDILRVGVAQPIMTIRINADTLPPRRRKKRIVWKLPESQETLPKFGMEDKRRILELYKERKKELKKQKKNQGVVNQQSSNAGLITDTPGADGRENERSNHSSNETISSAPRVAVPSSTSTNTIQPSRVSSHSLPVMDNLSSARQKTEKSQTVPPPGFANLSISSPTTESKSSAVAVKSAMTSSDRTSRNRMRSSNAHKNKTPQNCPTTPSAPPVTSNLPPPPGLSVPPAPNSKGHPSHNVACAVGPQSSQNGTGPLSHPIPASNATSQLPARFFFAEQQLQHTVNQQNGTTPNQQGVNRTTLTPLSQKLTETYYFLLAHGRCQELLHYYTADAEKSFTVGGAHAVCQGRADQLQQLQLLAVGRVFHIKGVLQQASVHQSVMVLITGICVIQGVSALPFCHSILLVPFTAHQDLREATDNTNHNRASSSQQSGHPTTSLTGYQIRNDSLCFLHQEIDGAPAAVPSNTPSNHSA